MYILGLNSNIHNSAAALIKDGIMIACAEEERFTRIKYDRSFPYNAIDFCLKTAGISLQDVDYIGFYWQPWKGLAKRIYYLLKYFPHSLETFKGGKEWRGSAYTLLEHLLVPLKLRKLGFKGKFYFIEHHLAHAASAFYLSGYENSAILSVDLVGENCTTFFATGTDKTITPIKRVFLPHSLGIFYAALTQYLGYKANSDEYRVMGLSSYGNPVYYDVFDKMIEFKDGELISDISWFTYHLGSENCYSSKFIDTFGAPCYTEDCVEGEKYKNIASSGQIVLEKVMIDMATWLRETTKMERLCMTGGVALNCVANGKLLRKGIFKEIWIQPAANDPGCSLGCCYYIWHQLLNNKRTYSMPHTFWGPEFTNEIIKDILDSYSNKIRYMYYENIESYTAKLLAEFKIIGWFQGRMEWGPRALGNRSILANPQKLEMKDIVNAKIKYREPYRPFAPSILEEYVGDYFEPAIKSPYMLFALNVKPDKRHLIPAVTHVDGTARVQTVEKEANPRYWNLINEFKKLTGIAVLLNTSFNVKGEPIVCTPKDAIECFLNTEIDYLVLGNFACQKK